MLSTKKVFSFFKKLVDTVPVVFVPIYLLTFLIPRNKKIWLFGSNMGRSFGDNPKYFYLYVNEKKNKEVRPIWISGDDSIVDTLRLNGYEAYSIYSFKGIFFALRSGVYIFDHHSKDICFWFSGGATKINLFHGVPLKKIHADNKFDEVRNPPNFYKRIRWSIRRLQNEKPSHYYLAPSKYVSGIFASAFRTSLDKGIVCGYPRNDIFFNRDYLHKNSSLVINNKRLYDDIKRLKSDNTKVIIYMPTFRKSENKFFDIVNLEKLNEFLKSNKSILLVKAHPMSKLQNEFKNIHYTNIFNIVSTEDPYPFLDISDMLITDYSSVYFDYLLTNRPIIFFSYDLETYINESRELYYEYNSVTPGIKARSMKEIIESIQYILNDSDDYREDREKLLNELFDHNDGNSVRRLYEKINEIIQ